MPNIQLSPQPRCIMAVCHCILNPASKVASLDAAEYEAERALRDSAVETLLRHGVGLLQLPCPELTLYGAIRWGHVKEQFDNPFFRAHCRSILAPYLDQLAEYASHPDRFRILGILGIDGSPSCGVHKTCTGAWGGELFSSGAQRALPQPTMKEGQGVFIEELQLLLNARGLTIPILSLNTFSSDLFA